MQQVHTIKTGANTQDLPPTVENNEGHLLTATCDTFIKTLDELMDLADTHFNIYGGGPLENGARRVSIILEFLKKIFSYFMEVSKNKQILFWPF